MNLTSLITGDGTYSLRISDSVGGADYSSKEGTNAPKLLVAVAGATPQSCAPAATATATPGPTNTPTQTPTPGPSLTPTKTSTPTAISTPTATLPPPPAPFNNAIFVYDGDGRRVKSTINGTTTTYFVGSHYEVANGVVTKYYYAGSQRIAMRSSGTLYFMFGDHLGSTSLTTFANGNVVSELQYKAWGEVRYASGTTPTKYQYTGQYSYASDFGLLFYNARRYDSSLGRFAQADTIIPSGVQGYDRYAYVNNSPINYTDPSGHGVDCGIGMGCVNDYSGASTLDDFQDMGWNERKHWLADFAHERRESGLENWFDDIGSAIDFMINDPSLVREGGTAEVMDAAVLQAINDGWLIFREGDPVGGGGQGWAIFFDALINKTTSDPNSLIVLRLQAEQYGVDYAWGLASTQSAYNNSSELDQIYFDIFKWGADSYRSKASQFRSDPLAIDVAENISYLQPLLTVTDPRTSGPFLNFVGGFGYPAAIVIWSWGNSIPPTTR